MWFTWLLAMQLWNLREDRLESWQAPQENAVHPVKNRPRVPHEPEALVA